MLTCAYGKSEHREIIRGGEIEMIGRELERVALIEAVITDLQQQVTWLAAAEGPVHGFVVFLDQVLDRFFVVFEIPAWGTRV